MKSFMSGLMGSSPKQGSGSPPEKYVLVPPMFERDIKDRDRFAYSSFDYLFAKRPLKFLFEDYLAPYPKANLFFCPPAEALATGVSVEASVDPSDVFMNVSYRPYGLSQPATFIDVLVAPKRQERAAMRCSFFDPSLGVGAFVTAPLAKRLSGTYAQVGLRYSSPLIGAGLIYEPVNNRAAALWLVGRHESGLMLGVQVKPQPGASLTECVSDINTLRNNASFALAFQPTNESGRVQFTGSVEMQENRKLVVSFYQHMAQIRQVVNPVEDKNIVGITNYIDLGLQIALPLDDAPAAPAATAATAGPSRVGAPDSSKAPGLAAPHQDLFNVAAAWQLNKNWLFKARVGDSSATASVAVKSWTKLGVALAASVTCRYADPMNPKYGGVIQLENFGEKRYERGVSEVAGRAVLQRHEANQVDIANVEGTGKVVMKEAAQAEYNVPAVDRTAQYL